MQITFMTWHDFYITQLHLLLSWLNGTHIHQVEGGHFEKYFSLLFLRFRLHLLRVLGHSSFIGTK